MVLWLERVADDALRVSRVTPYQQRSWAGRLLTSWVFWPVAVLLVSFLWQLLPGGARDVAFQDLGAETPHAYSCAAGPKPRG